MKIDKIKQAIKINAKLIELGIDINSKDWESFNFKLDEWGNLIIKSSKLDHKPFVSAKSAKPKKITRNNERLGEIWNEVMNEAMKKVSEPLGNSEQLELTFESVTKIANSKGFQLEWLGFYYLIPLNSVYGTKKYVPFSILQEVVNYLSELK